VSGYPYSMTTTHAITYETPEQLLFPRLHVRCACGWDWLEVAPMGDKPSRVRGRCALRAEQHLNHAHDLGDEVPLSAYDAL